MCVHLNTLPDDCLLPIFDRIPLADLFILNRVCPRWASLFPSACARRYTLVLILGGTRLAETAFQIPFNNNFDVTLDGHQLNYDLSVSEREASFTLPSLMPDALFIGGGTNFTELACLRRARLSGRLVAFFAELFPNVNKLVVIHSKCYEHELLSLIDLLGSSWPLRILKLWIHTWFIDEQYLDRHDQHPIRTLLHSIGQQSSLQQLTLDMNGPGWLIAFPAESYSFITQLKVLKLCLGRYDHQNEILDIVHRFDSPQLRHIGLAIKTNQVGPLMDPKFQFTTKVHQLYSPLYFESLDQFRGFCGRFPFLTILRMYWSPDISFAQLVNNLAPLAQLAHLEIRFQAQDHPENPFAMVDDDGQGVSLPQVKNLNLAISNKLSHQDFESLSRFVFPSLEVILLWDTASECPNCPPELANQCHRRLVLSLRNKFVVTNPTLRFYACRATGWPFVDWTNYVRNEEDDDDDLQEEELGA